MSLSLARNLDTGLWTITDGADLDLVITTNRGRVFNFTSAQTVESVVENGDSYFAIVETQGRSGVTWARFDFDPTGRQLGGRATALDIRELLAVETTVNADLNGDTDIGFEINGAALNRNGDTVELYALSAGAFGIVTNVGMGGESIVPLLDTRGNLWSAGVGREAVAVRAEGAGWKIMVEEIHRGAKRYFEFDVSSNGTVASRARLMTEFEAVALEREYGGSINGELTQAAELAEEFQKAAAARLDRGSGDASIWNISAGGFGVIVIDANGEDTFFALKNSDGTRFMPGHDQTIVAVRQEGADFWIILETVRPISTTYIELAVAADGTVAPRGEILRGDDLFKAEVEYKTDVNDDGVITVPAGTTFELRLDPEANLPLDFSGSQGTIVLDGEEFGNANTLTLLGNGAVKLINFSGTLDASEMTAMVTVEADGTTAITAQTTTGGITLTGAGAVTVNDLSTSVDASASTGALTVNTLASSTPTITTGSGTTIINSGNNNALVNAALLTDTLEVNGAGVVTGTGLGVNVDAVDFTGKFTVTTKDNATLTTTTGLGNTTINSDGSGTITVAGAALASTSTLTLNGSSAYAPTDLSGTTVAYTGSGSLDLTPQGALSLNLTNSTGTVSVDTSAQNGGRLTVTGTPATGPTITGNGAVTLHVGVANTSLAQVSAEADLTVTITAPGTTTLTAAQADGSTMTGPTAGSFAITDSAAETLYDFAGVAVSNTSVTFTSGGVLATTAFGSVNRFIVSGDSTVTMTTSQASGKNLVADGSNKIVFDLANGNNLNMVVPVANMPANYDLALQANATVVMFVTQHENAGAVSGAGNERIILEGGGTVHARPDIKTYQQAGAGALTVVVSDENTGVNVTGNFDNTIVNVGGLTVTGSYAMGEGANTLQLGYGASITGVNGGGVTTAQTVVVDGAATMTTAQHQGFTTITGGGGADVITLNTGGAVTAVAAIESYVLSDAGNVITVNAAKTDVTITGGAGNDTVIVGAGLAVTGTYDLGGGANMLRLDDGANIAGATISATGGSYAIEIDAGASVTMTSAQHAFISTAPDAEAVTLSDAPETFTANVAVESYILADGDQSFVLATGAQSVTTGTGDVTISTGDVTSFTTGAVNGTGSTTTLLVAQSADISGLSLTSVETINLADGVDATMTLVQNALITTAAGTNTVTLSEAGMAAAVAGVEAYVLAAAGNTLTVNAAKTDVTITGGAGNDTVIVGAGLAVTGTYDLGGSANILRLGDGANIADATIVATNGSYTIEIDAGASVTMTSAQNALIASAAGTNTVMLSDAGETTGKTDVETYFLADGDQRFFVGTAGQAVKTGTGLVDIATTVVTGPLDGSAGTVRLFLYGGDMLDFTGVSLTEIDSLFVQPGGVKLTAAQADGLSAIGNGTVIVTGLTETADLSGYSGSLTLKAEVTGTVDVTANANLGPVDEFVVGAGATLTINAAQADGLNATGNGTVVLTVGDFAVTGSYDLGGGANIAGATISATGGSYAIEIDAGASVTMTSAQHAFISTAPDAEAVTLSDAPETFTANVAVESYILADGDQSFVLATGAQSVTTGTGDVTISTGDVTSFTTGAVNGTGSTTTLLVAQSADISGLSLTSVETINLADGVDATMTLVQNALITTAAGTNTVTLSEAGMAAAVAGVEAYVLAAAGNTLTVNAAKTDVTITGGAGNDTVIVGAGLAVTGTYDLGGSANILRLGDGANIADATIVATNGSYTIEIDAGASVTMTSAQNALIASAAGTNTVMLSDAGETTGKTDVETYFLADGDQRFFVGTAGQAVKTGTGLVDIATTVVTGPLDGSAGTVRLFLYGGDMLDFTGVSLTEIDSLFVQPGGVKLTAAQADGLSAIGNGTVIVTGLTETADLSGYSGSLTLKAEVTGTVDVTANANLGPVDEFVVGAGATLTINAAQADGLNATGNGTVVLTVGDFAVTGSYDLGEGSNVLRLGDGANIADATIVATNGSYAIEIEAGASVTMTSAQHAFISTAPDAETVTLSDAPETFTANVAVESYILADGDQSFVLATGAQSVTTGTGDVTISTGDVTSFTTGAVNGTGSTTTLLVAQSADISGLSLTSVETINLADGVTLRLTAAQADGLSVAGAGNVIVTALGGSEADLSGITVSGDVSLDFGNSDPVVGEGFTFGARDYDVIGAGTLDVSQVTQDLSLVTSFDVAANSVLAATAGQMAQIGIDSITGDGTLRAIATVDGGTLDSRGATIASVVLVGGAAADTFVFSDGVSVEGFDANQDFLDVAGFASPVRIEELSWSGRGSDSQVSRSFDVDEVNGTVSSVATSTTLSSTQGMFSWLATTFDVAGDYRFSYSLTTDQGEFATLGTTGSSNTNLLSYDLAFAPSTRTGEATFIMPTNETLQFDFRVTETGGNGDMTLVLALLGGPDAPLLFDDIARTDVEGDAVLTIDGTSLALLDVNAKDIMSDWFIFA